MLDPEEEQKYEQLSKLAQALHIPMPQHFIELEVRDKDGRVIQRHKQRSHSWTRNAYNLLFGTMAAKNLSDLTPDFGAGYLSIKIPTGIIRGAAAATSAPPSDNLDISGISTYGGYLANAVIDTRGIVVGTGATAESFEDYKLDTPVAEGTGLGQLSHVASELHNITWPGGGLTMADAQVRYLNNNSGGAIVIAEVGIIIGVDVGGGLPNQLALMSRDVLGATVTVPDTGQLKVTYTFELVYPA